MLKDSLKTIITSFMALSLISIAHAWTEPTSNPPTGNVSAPINNSSTPQAKLGDLGIKGLLRGYDTGALFTGTTSTNPVSGACPSGYYWVDENGNGSKDNEECKTISLYAGSNGNVGIGTANPGKKLDVAGDISTSGDVVIAGQSVCRKDGTNCTRQPSASQINFEDGTIQKTAFPDCQAGEYARKKSDNSGWECVSGLWGPAGSLHYFVTATAYKADMGGHSGMEAKCNSDANRISGRIYAAVTSENWGMKGATYFGNYGTGVNGTGKHTGGTNFWGASFNGGNCEDWTRTGGFVRGGTITFGEIIGTTDTRYNYQCDEVNPILCAEVAK